MGVNCSLAWLGCAIGQQQSEQLQTLLVRPCCVFEASTYCDGYVERRYAVPGCIQMPPDIVGEAWVNLSDEIVKKDPMLAVASCTNNHVRPMMHQAWKTPILDETKTSCPPVACSSLCCQVLLVPFLLPYAVHIVSTI